MQPRHARSSTAARPVAPPTQTADRPTEKPVEFILHRPQAKSVSVAGTFNAWDPKRNPLRKNSSGIFKATVWLPPGRYEYRFVVDGNQWLSDPQAAESVHNNFGETNSVLKID